MLIWNIDSSLFVQGGYFLIGWYYRQTFMLSHIHTKTLTYKEHLYELGLLIRVQVFGQKKVYKKVIISNKVKMLTSYTRDNVKCKNKSQTNIYVKQNSECQ